MLSVRLSMKWNQNAGMYNASPASITTSMPLALRSAAMPSGDVQSAAECRAEGPSRSIARLSHSEGRERMYRFRPRTMKMKLRPAARGRHGERREKYTALQRFKSI
jgi:hypothetical protein